MNNKDMINYIVGGIYMLMKNYAKIFSILLLSALLQGCGSISTYQKSIYNDDSKIIKKDDNYSFINNSRVMVNNTLSMEYGTFYGMVTIWEIKSEGKGSVTVKFNSEVNKGKFKAVFITPDNDVVKILEQNDEGKKTIETKSGTSRIKIVGNGAGGHLDISVEPEGDAHVRMAYD